VKLSDNPTGNDPDVAEARVLYQLSQK
jgi:hypothetical protein